MLVRELKELLVSSEGQGIPVSIVLARFHQHFGRLLNVDDYGVHRIEELIEGLPSLQVRNNLTLQPCHTTPIAYCVSLVTMIMTMIIMIMAMIIMAMIIFGKCLDCL